MYSFWNFFGVLVAAFASVFTALGKLLGSFSTVGVVVVCMVLVSGCGMQTMTAEEQITYIDKLETVLANAGCFGVAMVDLDRAEFGIKNAVYGSGLKGSVVLVANPSAGPRTFTITPTAPEGGAE